MTRTQRLAPLGAVLLALPLTGCGGAPTDASTADFCAAVNDRSWVEELGTDPDGEEIVAQLEKWGGELEETGTPEEIADDAREGFDITVDYLGDLDPDDFDNLEDLDPSAGDLSEDEQEKVDAFYAYVADTCVPEDVVDVPEPSIS